MVKKNETHHIHIAGRYSIFAALIGALIGASVTLYIFFEQKKSEENISQEPTFIKNESNRENKLAEIEEEISEIREENESLKKRLNLYEKKESTKTTQNSVPESPKLNLVSGKKYRVRYFVRNSCGLALRSKALSRNELNELNYCQSNDIQTQKCREIDEESYTGICVAHGQDVIYIETNGNFFKIKDLATNRIGYISKNFANQITLN